jgi:hypothetical protein
VNIRRIPNRKGEKVLDQFRAILFLRKRECDVPQKQEKPDDHIFSQKRCAHPIEDRPLVHADGSRRESNEEVEKYQRHYHPPARSPS